MSHTFGRILDRKIGTLPTKVLKQDEADGKGGQKRWTENS